jgi:molybdopterin-guanine dinucleotide biosynthesis protein A
MRLCVGIFVGGQARRFGGIVKGLLATADGRSIVARLIDVVREALPAAPIYLVGDARAYAGFGLPSLNDAPPGIGPLGGLRALLERAREDGLASAIALACDLPAIDAALVQRLAESAPRALSLAPKTEGGRWSALSARYATGTLPLVEALIAEREHSLQRLFAGLGERAIELPISRDELARLMDWDQPEDIGGA